MKTKTYTFTEIEILALREAMDFYYHEVSKRVGALDKLSPLFANMHKSVKALKDQFKDDLRLL